MEAELRTGALALAERAPGPALGHPVAPGAITPRR